MKSVKAEPLHPSSISESKARHYAQVLLDYPGRGTARNYLTAISMLNRVSGGTQAAALFKAYRQAPSEPLNAFKTPDWIDRPPPPRATTLLAGRKLDEAFYPGGADLLQNSMQAWVLKGTTSSERAERACEVSSLYQAVNPSYQWQPLTTRAWVKTAG